MNSNDEVKKDNIDATGNNNTEHSSDGNHGCGSGRHNKWKIPFIIAIVLAVKSALVLLLWNALIPELFHGPELNYLQAFELTVLAKILTGFGGGGFKHRFCHHHHRGHHHLGGRHRWMHMSREEKMKMREEMKSRCRW